MNNRNRNKIKAMLMCYDQYRIGKRIYLLSKRWCDRPIKVVFKD